MKTFARFASSLLLLASASVAADDKAQHTFPSCRDCGIVRSIRPAHAPSVSPGGARGGGLGGVTGGVLGGPRGNSGGGMGNGPPSWTVLVQMDSGGSRELTISDLAGLETGDKVRVVGLNLERIQP
jgi:hypothetical protein